MTQSANWCKSRFRISLESYNEGASLQTSISNHISQCLDPRGPDSELREVNKSVFHITNVGRISIGKVSSITSGTLSGLLQSACSQVRILLLALTISLTVGYGDISIIVNTSRIFFMLAVAWGSVIYSLFIVSMHVLTTLTPEEQDVYTAVITKEDTLSLRKGHAESTVFSFLVFLKRHQAKRMLLSKKRSITYRDHYTSAQRKRLDRQLGEIKSHSFYCDLIFHALLFQKQRKAV